MGQPSRAAQRALHAWNRMRLELGTELREARIGNGLTQQQVGRALGVTGSQICRRELGNAPSLSGAQIVMHGAVVGLRASVKFYPAAGALRDVSQARYIARFVERIGHAWKVVLDAPIPIRGDQRGIDVWLSNPDCEIVVEVVTRLRDLQAQLRSAQLKARDAGAKRFILVIAGTHANRQALSEARATLLASYELDTRRVLAGLGAGRDPGRDAVIVL